MVSLEELNKIYLLQNLETGMLEDIRPFVELRDFQNREVIFREGDKARYFYMLLRGGVLLEVQASPSILISLGSIKPGFSFGWSALLPEESFYTSYAVCTEASDVLMIQADKLLSLMEKNHSLGFRIMEGVVRILKRRLERRTEQFLKTLRNHPDIKEPFWE
ncbi:MAG: cyclic nucleotide-binding domain-containing protein [Deltaproteobacteria bacterium]|nr:cyclic nucleotide-binding domain-containing protein [Deltaproteobacteria bacterium]